MKLLIFLVYLNFVCYDYYIEQNISMSIILIEKYSIAIDSSIKVCDGNDNVVLMNPISKYIQSQRHVRVGR